MATLDEMIHCLAAPSLRRLFQVRKWGVGGGMKVYALKRSELMAPDLYLMGPRKN